MGFRCSIIKNNVALEFTRLLPIVQFAAGSQSFHPTKGGLEIMVDKIQTVAIVPKTNLVVLLLACSIGSNSA